MLSDPFVNTLQALVQDPIVDVRIRVSRLLGVLHGRSDVYMETTGSHVISTERVPNMPQGLVDVVRNFAAQLAQDASHDVQAFAKPLLQSLSSPASHKLDVTDSGKRSAETFSRPPPLAGS